MMSRSLLEFILLTVLAATDTKAIAISTVSIAAKNARVAFFVASHKKSRVSPKSLLEMSPKQLDTFIQTLGEKYPKLSDRILQVSERFIDTPYKASPLGEGQGNPPDEDPLIRFDAVDCTTFIEEVMALSIAEDFHQALKILKQIRYIDAKATYVNRKHFTEAQWIPNNQRIGFIEDITALVAPGQTIEILKHLDSKVWDKRSHPEKWPELDGKDIPSGTFSLPVIPIKNILSICKKIPNGTIINIVRQNIPSYPTRVTHQGLLVQKNGKTYLRHAGKAGYGRVVDEPIEHFVKRNMAYRKWLVTGFNLQKVLPGSKAMKTPDRFLHDNLAPIEPP